MHSFYSENSIANYNIIYTLKQYNKLINCIIIYRKFRNSIVYIGSLTYNQVIIKKLSDLFEKYLGNNALVILSYILIN